MNDSATGPANSSKTLALAILSPLVLFVVYVLSIGPAAAMCEHYDWDPAPLQTFYYPVIWLHEHTILREPLEWYVGLFGVE